MPVFCCKALDGLPSVVENLDNFFRYMETDQRCPARTLEAANSRRGPFSKSSKFCSMCFVLDAPMMIASPYSRFNWL